MTIFRALILTCWLARFAPAQEPACQPIGGDRILARDLAATLPVFSKLPADTLLATAPQPGSKRIFHAAELASLAQRYAIAFEPARDVCFEWTMRSLDRLQVLEAMRASLQVPEARIEIAETSLYPVPIGRIEFPRERLGTPASPDQRDPVLWRGDVVYGGEHRYAVWARVRVTVQCEKLIARENLKTGRPIAAEQLRSEPGECFPGPDRTVLNKEQAVGMLPLRSIPAGAGLLPNWLANPYDVARGDLVEIEVRSGGTRLKFSARAESDGRFGDSIAIRNPESNRIFQARVNGKDKAVVQTGSVKGN